MKNLKKIISLTLVLALVVLSSFSVFAEANENGDYIGVKTSKSALKVGETLEAYVYAYNNSGDTVISTGTADIGLQFDNAGFRVKEVKYVTSVGETVNPKATEVQYLINGITSPVTFSDANKILLVEFEAIAEGTYDFSVREESGIGDVVYWEVIEYPEDGGLLPAVSVTVAAAGEEDFTVSGAAPVEGDEVGGIELGANATQLAVFSKAVEAPLAEGEYGIIFKGIKFPGAAPVAAGQAWCIKLVAPNGVNKDNTAFAGTYTFTTFVGEVESEAKTVTVQ